MVENNFIAALGSQKRVCKGFLELVGTEKPKTANN
jgi:hypothetical protein